MKIALFDSGLGGLSVLHHALKVLPQADFIYYADEKNVPYGEKSPEQIKGFLRGIMDFFLTHDADAVVIACNTASSVMSKEFRAEFPLPIIAMEPAVKLAVERYPNAKILAAATEVTVRGRKFADLLSNLNSPNVRVIALPGLVRLAERGKFGSEEARKYLQDALVGLAPFEVLVLGCTHFNYFKSDFLALNSNLKFVDGNAGTIAHLARKLGLEIRSNLNGKTEISARKVSNLNCENVEFYFSGEPVNGEERDFIALCLERLENEYKIN